MRDTVTENHEKIEQKLSKHFISFDFFFLDISQYKFKKVEHVKRGSIILTHIFHF